MNLKGVYHAIPTQFRRNQSLDLASTADHIDHLIEAGANGIVLLSPTAEPDTLSPDEKLRIVEVALNTNNGRVPVFTAVCEAGTGTARTFIRDAEEIGIDGLILYPPHNYQPDHRELTNHFKVLTQATDLPTVLHHDAIELIKVLSSIDHLTTLFIPNLDPEHLDALLQEFQDNLSIFTSLSANPSVIRQAQGLITNTGSIFPWYTHSIWQLFQQTKIEEAETELAKLVPLNELCESAKAVQYIKQALRKMGQGAEWVREPRLPLNKNERENLFHILRKIKQNIPAEPRP